MSEVHETPDGDLEVPKEAQVFIHEISMEHTDMLTDEGVIGQCLLIAFMGQRVTTGEMVATAILIPPRHEESLIEQLEHQIKHRDGLIHDC